MIEWIVQIVAGAFLIAGSVFYVIGALGLYRMPDVFARMHATSVSDTVGAGLMLVGMMIYAGLSLVTLKLAVILLLILYTGPVATHALARAALHAGLKPMLDDDKGEPSSKP